MDQKILWAVNHMPKTEDKNLPIMGLEAVSYTHLPLPEPLPAPESPVSQPLRGRLRLPDTVWYLPDVYKRQVAVPIVQLACSFIDELRIICNQVVFRLPKNLIQNGNWNQPALDQFMKHIASHISTIENRTEPYNCSPFLQSSAWILSSSK